MRLSIKDLKLLVVPVVGLLFFLINPFSLQEKAAIVLSLGVVMILWWVLEVLPLAVVALVPIIFFPLFGIAPVKEVTKSYADSTIFLFMGGFFIALAIESFSVITHLLSLR